MTNLLIMLLNEHSTISLESFVKLFGVESKIDITMLTNDFLELFIKIIQSFLNSLIISLRDIEILDLLFWGKA